MLVRTQITCEVEIKFLDFFFRGPRRGLGSEISSSVMRKANMSGWDEVHIRGYQPAQVVHSTPHSFKKLYSAFICKMLLQTGIFMAKSLKGPSVWCGDR